MSSFKTIFRKVGIALIGFPIILVGIVLLVLPGPGLLLIAIGLMILAIEFEWAERHHRRIRHHVSKLTKKVRDQGKTSNK